MNMSRSHPQRGMATVLTLLLIGMSLTATVMGVAYYVQGRQAQSITTHAQTQAQLNAWTGAQVLREYLDELHSTDQLVDFMALPTDPPLVLTLEGAGAVEAQITHMDSDTGQLVAKLTGWSAQGTHAQSSSILEAVYAVSMPVAEQCTEGPPRSSVMVKGSLNIIGGGSGFESANGLLDIIVEGDMQITQATQASFSGCAKGNITIDGGGVKPGGKVYAEDGIITFKQMTALEQSDVWGTSVTMELSGPGNIKAIRSGAYDVEIRDAQQSAIGHALMGGQLLSNADHEVLGGNPLTAGGLPWREGTLLPLNDGKVVLQMANGGQWLLDLSVVQVNPLTGAVSNIRKATQALQNGQKALPDVLYFQAKGVHGGDITMYRHNVGHIWGHHIVLQGENGSYGRTDAAGNLTVHSSALGSFTGGGDLFITKTNNAPLNQNLTFNAGSKLAGAVRDASGKALTPANVNRLFPNLTPYSRNTSPGLPGLPYCDARMPELDVDMYKPLANYVFEYIDGVPKLTVRNVRRQGAPVDTASIDKVYTLDGKDPVVRELLECDWGNNKGCTPSINDIQSKRWNLGGMKKFPIGTVWFDGDVTLTPTFAGLTNTLIAAGNVVLGNDTDVGNKKLTAPSHAGANAVCQSSPFYPIDVCAALRNPVPSGLSNVALMTEKDLHTNGWELHGHVQIGGGLGNASNTSHLYGTVAIGLNTQGKGTQLSSGGVMVHTNGLTDVQMIVPGATVCTAAAASASSATGNARALPSSARSTASSSAGAARIQWSRYL